MSRSRRLIMTILCISLLMIPLLTGNLLAAVRPELKIAGQFGLVYAPLMIAEKLEIFQKHGLTPVWKEYGSGAAVREGLISGEADVGFMGIPPFLIGWDKGCDWKVSMGFVVVPVGLVTNDPRITSIKDFKPTDKIAVPSPGSVQHILLSMDAKKELGAPTSLDQNLIALPHPDAAASLISKRGIVAHFTTPPYLFEELEQPGFRLVTDDVKAFGTRFSFNVGVVTTKFHNQRPAHYRAFVNAIEESMTWINQNTKKAAELLAPEFKLSPEKTYKYMTWPGMEYTTKALGLMGFANFMKEVGYIKKAPAHVREIVWENVKF